MLEQKNSKIQGNIGIGSAIAYFTSLGFIVSIPMNDAQEYDLIVDNGDLQRVQVKTTRYKRKNFEVSLSTNGGNRSGTGKIKYFDNSKVDYLFVLTEEGERYCIPSNEVTQIKVLCLNERYDEYKICVGQ